MLKVCVCIHPGGNLGEIINVFIFLFIFHGSALQEMLSAYFADFAKIDPAVICTWIFDLESQLSKLDEPKENEKPAISLE